MSKPIGCKIGTAVSAKAGSIIRKFFRQRCTCPTLL